MFNRFSLPMMVGFLFLFTAFACAADPRIGLVEDCSTTDGWYEWDKDQNKVTPRVKMESVDGHLIVHLNRGLLAAASRYPWVAPGVFPGSILRKDFGEVDLDKYPYLVVTVISKGSGVFFGVNGFDTKTGYTTGTTAVDLRQYDSDQIHGKRPVRLEMDLHDNSSTLVVDEIKLVSQLTPEEQKGFIDQGLTIRHENLKPVPNHGLDALILRAKTPPPHLDQEEMAIFRDSATGAITTRLTAAAGNDYFGEGEIWSADGAALSFISQRDLSGVPILLLDSGSVIPGPDHTSRYLWSPTNPDKLYFLRNQRHDYSVWEWDRSTRQSHKLVDFNVPEVGGYTELKRFTAQGNLIVAFRETPYLYLVNLRNNTVKSIVLPTRLKDASISDNETVVHWANCYTFEGLWKNLVNGEQGIGSSHVVGHASGGPAGTVGSFGTHLKIFIPSDLEATTTPGDRITVWANWQNDVITDYGTLTNDSRYVFTNGTDGDVANQHVMIPSDDTGAVMRVARYFTRFSWESTTYSRPSPDYTKLIYNENNIGSTELYMAYTRRPDAPRDLTLTGNRLTWAAPQRHDEIMGYNIYTSDTPGRNFQRINDQPFTETSYTLPLKYATAAPTCLTVTAVEHSGLESLFAQQIATQNPSTTFYFEAEELPAVTPARRFFDGYCNNFQCIRINAESPEEKARHGSISIPTDNLPSATYKLWARVKGTGSWTVGSISAPISSDDWTWIKLADNLNITPGQPLEISSSDDALKLDTLLLTTEDFTPTAPDPRDSIAPQPVTDLKAAATADNQVNLSWSPSPTLDLHHYSVYCGSTPDFTPSNASIVRSVTKASITDALPSSPKGLYYKVVAVDNRFNESQPVTVQVP